MTRVVIGTDLHKRSFTVEVMAPDETVLDGGRFATEESGYAAMLRHARRWPDRGRTGHGSHLPSTSA